MSGDSPVAWPPSSICVLPPASKSWSAIPTGPICPFRVCDCWPNMRSLTSATPGIARPRPVASLRSSRMKLFRPRPRHKPKRSIVVRQEISRALAGANRCRSYDRGVQFGPPMRKAILERRVADITEFFLIKPLEFLEGETIGAMRRPGVQQAAMRRRALAQREPQTGLDRAEIERAADPSLSCRRTAQGIDAGDRFALFIGRGGGLFVVSVHRHPVLQQAPSPLKRGD